VFSKALFAPLTTPKFLTHPATATGRHIKIGSPSQHTRPTGTAPPPSQDELEATAARAYPKLVALKGLTPAQVQTWVQANVTNLAQAQDAIMTLAIAVSILARRL
jgi:hypothetical protein